MPTEDSWHPNPPVPVRVYWKDAAFYHFPESDNPENHTPCERQTVGFFAYADSANTVLYGEIGDGGERYVYVIPTLMIVRQVTLYP